MGWWQRWCKGRKLEVRPHNICTDFYHNTSWSDCTEWKFTNWDVKDRWWGQQPDDRHGHEDCLQMGGLDDYGWHDEWNDGLHDGWHDVVCLEKKKYVCSRTLCGTGVSAGSPLTRRRTTRATTRATTERPTTKRQLSDQQLSDLVCKLFGENCH